MSEYKIGDKVLWMRCSDFDIDYIEKITPSGRITLKYHQGYFNPDGIMRGDYYGGTKIVPFTNEKLDELDKKHTIGRAINMMWSVAPMGITYEQAEKILEILKNKKRVSIEQFKKGKFAILCTDEEQAYELLMQIECEGIDEWFDRMPLCNICTEELETRWKGRKGSRIGTAYKFTYRGLETMYVYEYTVNKNIIRYENIEWEEYE